MKQGLDQHIACKPVEPQARVPLNAALAGVMAATPAARMSLEIEDVDGFDKAIQPRHASGAHLLRERSACYTRSDRELDMAAAVEPGRFRRGRKGIR
jgi:hypothetical protein